MKKLLLLSVLAWSFAAESVAAECWHLQFRDGSSLEAQQLWQIKSRISEQGQLLGETDGQDNAIAVSDVQTILPIQPIQPVGATSGWRALLAPDKETLELTLAGSQVVHMDSILPLHFSVAEEERQAPLKDIERVSRCDPGGRAAPAEPEPGPALPGAQRAGVVLSMVNSDVISGVCKSASVSIRAEYAVLSLDTASLDSLERSQDDPDIVQVRFGNGNQVSGEWLDDTLGLEVSPGQVVDIATRMIIRMEFNRR